MFARCVTAARSMVWIFADKQDLYRKSSDKPVCKQFDTGCDLLMLGCLDLVSHKLSLSTWVGPDHLWTTCIARIVASQLKWHTSNAQKALKKYSGSHMACNVIGQIRIKCEAIVAGVTGLDIADF